jgi:hypothetical protein
MRKGIIAGVIAGMLSAAAPALAQELRLIDALKQQAVEKAIAKIREVEAQTQRFREEQPANHGFSVILALGDLQGGAPARDLPPAARKALADMSQFLPYKSYALLDARWILGTPRSTALVQGPENREFELELRTSPRPDNEVQIDFYLRDPSRAVPFAPGRGLRSGAARNTVRVIKRPGRIIDTTFNMDVGETVVVGTSRLQGEKALIVLLTAVGK